jgi:hypothetical protein
MIDDVQALVLDLTCVGLRDTRYALERLKPEMPWLAKSTNAALLNLMYYIKFHLGKNKIKRIIAMVDRVVLGFGDTDSAEGRLRKEIFETNILEGIVDFPGSIFYEDRPRGPGSLWIFNCDKPVKDDLYITSPDNLHKMINPVYSRSEYLCDKDLNVWLRAIKLRKPNSKYLKFVHFSYFSLIEFQMRHPIYRYVSDPLKAYTLRDIKHIDTSSDESQGFPIIKKIYKDKKPDPIFGFYRKKIGGQNVVVEYHYDPDFVLTEQVFSCEGSLVSVFKKKLLTNFPDAWIHRPSIKCGY